MGYYWSSHPHVAKPNHRFLHFLLKTKKEVAWTDHRIYRLKQTTNRGGNRIGLAIVGTDTGLSRFRTNTVVTLKVGVGPNIGVIFGD